ncbi:MAG: hypothetical protein L0Z62_36110 [Gemmataceae bacterium]|nr:hypothetical protein [Gemmataceae bacterium]
MLKKALSLLGLATITTSLVLWSAEHKVLAGAGAAQAHFAPTAPGPPQIGHEQQRLGPFPNVHRAREQSRALEREGWRCRIRQEGRWWFVHATREIEFRFLPGK